MGKSIAPLLAEITEPSQGYSEAIVVDDHSRRDEAAIAAEACRHYGAAFAANSENVGPADNRNRIALHQLYRNSVMHFLDADVSLITSESAIRARELVSDPSVGMAGGLILEKDGRPASYNFGPAFTLKSGIGFNMQQRYAEMAKIDPASAEAFREKHHFWLGCWPDIVNQQTTQRAVWVAEANMVVDADRFAEVGGFGNNVRFHDIVTPAMRLLQQGKHALFDPSVAVIHKGLGDHSGRPREMVAAMARLIFRHGVGNFLFGGDMAAGKWGRV